MARQIDMKITGTMGNLIFYESKGDFLMRPVPVQTEATQKVAKELWVIVSHCGLSNFLIHEPK